MVCDGLEVTSDCIMVVVLSISFDGRVIGKDRSEGDVGALWKIWTVNPAVGRKWLAQLLATL